MVRPMANHDRGGVVALSRSLEADETPCSFWSLTTERLDEWLADPARYTEIGGGIAGIVMDGLYIP